VARAQRRAAGSPNPLEIGGAFAAIYVIWGSTKN